MICKNLDGGVGPLPAEISLEIVCGAAATTDSATPNAASAKFRLYSPRSFWRRRPDRAQAFRSDHSSRIDYKAGCVASTAARTECPASRAAFTVSRPIPLLAPMIRTLATPVNALVGPATHRDVRSRQPYRKTHGRVITERPGFLYAPRHSPNAHHKVTLMAKGRGLYCRGYCHGPLRWQASRRQANNRPRGIGRAALSHWRRPRALCTRRGSL